MLRTSLEIDKISEALAAAQAEFGPVVKNKTNPHYKNTYADLTSQVDATRLPLSHHGIFVFQTSPIIDGRLLVITRLIHKSGQWLESDVSLKIGQDTPQGAGSCITYGRRYGRAMALDLGAEDDDDATNAEPENETAKSLSVFLEAFKKYGITQNHLETYFRKKREHWDKRELNECLNLGTQFKEKKSDPQHFIDDLAIMHL